MQEKKEKYPEGHFIGMWIGIGAAIFSGIGLPLSIILKNSGFIGIGPAIGVAVGIAIGSSIEEKYKKEGKIRPLTEKEKKRKQALVKIVLIILIILFLLGIGVFMFLR